MHIYRPAPTRSPIISAALHAFPRLTHLLLCCNELLPPDAAPLQALTALRSLDICCHFGLATSVAAAAVSLTSLTALSLARVTSTADNLPPAGLHTSLTRLTQLHALTILYNVAPPDEAAAGDEPVLNAGGVPMLVLPSFSELPALERLEVSYQAGIQMGAAKLSACSYSRSTTGKGVLELDLDKADDESTLAALLAATLPPSTSPDSQLRSLTLTHSRLSSAQCRGCAAWLEHLTSCSLHYCHPEGGLTELLSELLPCLPRLRALKLDSCSGVDDGEVPSAITELQGLRKLTLKDLRLESLPPGRYLNELTLLDLRANNFRWLPLALREATNLRTLKLNRCPLSLGMCDASTVLRNMHMLRVLQLDHLHVQPPEVLQELKRTQPMLKVEGEMYDSM
ncbi:hypothetical protein D9Q98_007258 [Chlorella vulgaris]|uniref:Uncharacterized protein n=1 Tax=Chlorella vulgaris TaxID=3077 RepID=A0A9D4TKV9_CHLVU|nr:hypothetical protein D9Q98_007258 [Chlorella vulgaris]